MFPDMNELLDLTIAALLERHPEVGPVFVTHGLEALVGPEGLRVLAPFLSLGTALHSRGIAPEPFLRLLEAATAGDRVIDAPGLEDARSSGELTLLALMPCGLKVPFGRALAAFAAQLGHFRSGATSPVAKVTIIGGRDKAGGREAVRLELRPGDVVCVVGPTGSGKSRLLADIERLAQGDTPSGRQILVDDRPPATASRFSGEQQLVAQLSQSMNLVMDLSVREFLQMHAESRLVADAAAVIEQIYATAEERSDLVRLELLDWELGRMRDKLRQGEGVGFDLPALPAAAAAAG